MDRARLAQLLSEAGGGVFSACQDALLTGAHFWVEEHGGPAAHAAVTALRAQGDQLIRIGAVDLDGPPYHYQLFVRDDLSAAVAGLGVDLRLGFRLRQGDQVLLICDVVGEDSSSFPGWLRVRFTDAAGREWDLVDKAPIFGTASESRGARPDTATVRVTVIELLPQEPTGAAPLVQVSTALDGVSAADGTDVFIVSDTVLRR
ncbi:MAG TPA: hypothetical protein VHH34_21500, partial [Pseudonocardiaceae bacterium]|nr:hypothetical protein [Pseudonocardiaceae bacterium]